MEKAAEYFEKAADLGFELAQVISSIKAGFPLSEFVRANREKSNLIG